MSVILKWASANPYECALPDEGESPPVDCKDTVKDPDYQNCITLMNNGSSCDGLLDTSTQNGHYDKLAAQDV